jgi:ATP-dependent DNA helicase RecG
MEIKKETADAVTNRITFIEIYEVHHKGKRVLMFQIPPSPGTVVMYNGHAYGRDGESLVGLSLEKMDRIRSISTDWSAELLDRTIEDLDKAAISVARAGYTEAKPRTAEESSGWSDEEFLTRLKLMHNGKITRAAALLLGKDTVSSDLGNMVRITWAIKNQKNDTLDYEHYPMPFITSSKAVCERITNLTYRRLMEGLVPTSMSTYDPLTIREALNNCIMHADYRISRIINVVEIQNDSIIFTNSGSFIPDSVESAVLSNGLQSVYRNPLLAEAMIDFGLVDAVGSGMKKMFISQAERYFPMPEYEMDDKHVSVTITGHSIDHAYEEILYYNPDLTLRDKILLDKVQKKLPISDEDAAHLRSRKFISGRKPAYLLLGTSSLETSTKLRDDILQLLNEKNGLDRSDIDGHFISGHISKDKISYVLRELVRSGKIENTGKKKKPHYVISK